MRHCDRRFDKIHLLNFIFATFSRFEKIQNNVIVLICGIYIKQNNVIEVSQFCTVFLIYIKQDQKKSFV
jgi:hypothetical protein